MRSIIQSVLVLAAGLVQINAAQAQQAQTLAKVTSDRDGNVSRLVAIVDSKNEISSIRFDTRENVNGNLGETTSVSFSMRQIQSDTGVVLVTTQGYNAVILRAAIDGKNGNGNVVVRFLTDAFANSYQSCKAIVKRGSDNKWILLNINTKRLVTDLYVQSHMTGITTIRGICD